MYEYRLLIETQLTKTTWANYLYHFSNEQNAAYRITVRSGETDAARSKTQAPDTLFPADAPGSMSKTFLLDDGENGWADYWFYPYLTGLDTGVYCEDVGTPKTHAGAEAYAVAKGGRLPTKWELRQHIRVSMDGYAIFPGKDQWAAVRDPDAQTKGEWPEDYIQVGDSAALPVLLSQSNLEERYSLTAAYTAGVTRQAGGTDHGNLAPATRHSVCYVKQQILDEAYVESHKLTQYGGCRYYNTSDTTLYHRPIKATTARNSYSLEDPKVRYDDDGYEQWYVKVPTNLLRNYTAGL